jgi:RNA polymerase sigma-70 factor (ECF subfamily)
VVHQDRSSLESLAVQSAKVHRLALALTRDAHGAEDLAQDAMLALLRSQPAAAESLASWLSATLKNLLRLRNRSEVRRRQREQLVARSESDSSAEQALEHLELHEALFRAVRELKEPYRTTVLLRWFEDLEPVEIARRTGVPVRTVHTRVSRALILLRGKLQREAAARTSTGWSVVFPLAVIEKAWKGTWMAKASTKALAGAIVLVVASATVAVIYPSLFHDSNPLEAASTTPNPSPPIIEVPKEDADRRGEQAGSAPERDASIPPSGRADSQGDGAQAAASVLEGAQAASMLETAVSSFLTASPDLASFEAALDSFAKLSQVDPLSVQENPKDGSITGKLLVPGVEVQASFRIQGHQYELSVEPSPGNPLPPPFGWRDIKVSFLEASGVPQEIRAYVQYNPDPKRHAIDSIPSGEERYMGWDFTIGPEETRGLPISIQQTSDGSGWRVGQAVALPGTGGRWPFHASLYEGWLAKLEPYAP